MNKFAFDTKNTSITKISWILEKMNSFNKIGKNIFNNDLSLVSGLIDSNFWPDPRFPHYNTIVIDNDSFKIELALAGYNKNDITVELVNNTISIYTKYQESSCSNVENENEDDALSYQNEYPFFIHKGISQKAFNISFKLPHNAVVGNPKFDNGLLSIIISSNTKESFSKVLTIQ